MPKEIPPKNETLIKIASTIIVLSLPIFLTMTNFIYLFQNEKFYFATFEKIGVYQQFARSDVEGVTKELLAFFKSSSNLNSLFFSQQAKLHLADVKSLFEIAKITHILSVVLIIFSAFHLYLQNQKTQILISAKKGTIFLTFLILVCGLLTILNFAFFFQKFHEIFFFNNLWLFPEDDNLIMLFPQAFFIEFLKQIFVNIIATALGTFLVVKLLEKWLIPTSK